MPIRRLEEHVKKGMQKEFGNGKLNEIETIQQAVRFLSDGLDMVNRQMKELEPLQRDYAVFRLLKGLEYKKEYLPSFLQREEFGMNYLVVCMDPCPGEIGPGQYDCIKRQGNDWLKGIEVLGKPFMERDTLILCFDSSVSERFIEKLGKIAELLERQGNREIRFYTSSLKSSVNSISNAYFEACLTWDFFRVQNRKGLFLMKR